MNNKKRYIRRILLVLFSTVILISAFLLLDFAGLISLRPVNIDKLYSGYMQKLEVPGPEFLPAEEYLEISLKDEFLNSALAESTMLSESEKLAVINKWSKELRPYFGSFMLASAMDSLPYKTGEGILKNSEGAEKTADSIGLWAINRLQHTQNFDFFKGFPGKDPWGSLNLFEPLYKKVLPSEMLAKSAYTGKVTGKCCSLAALNTSIFAVAGADPEDIIILRFDSHEIGLIKYGGVLYVSNNEHIDPMNTTIMNYLLKQNYKGFFSYSLSVMQNFKLVEAIFNSKTTLVQALASLTGTSDRLLAEKLLAADVMQNRETLHARIFGSTDDEAQNRLFTLARYAYQSLYVKEPELYLKASVRAPVTKALADKLRSEKDIISWIENNITDAPLFDDYAERLMLADQVVVFKKGSPKDQAVLAYSLLWLNSLKSVIKITDKTAYVEVGQRVYDAKTWNTVDSPEGIVLLELKID